MTGLGDDEPGGVRERRLAGRRRCRLIRQPEVGLVAGTVLDDPPDHAHGQRAVATRLDGHVASGVQQPVAGPDVNHVVAKGSARRRGGDLAAEGLHREIGLGDVEAEEQHILGVEQVWLKRVAHAVQ
jgi:hypothetical protein